EISKDEVQKISEVLTDGTTQINKVDNKEQAYSILKTTTDKIYSTLGVTDKTKYKYPEIEVRDSRQRFTADVTVERGGEKTELEQVQFEDEADIEACVKSCPNTSSRNGLTVIISDFMTESNWKKAVDYLCYKKRQVLLVQIMTPEELEPSYDGRVNLIDSESIDLIDPRNMKIKITRSMQKAYEEALNDFKQEIKTYCSKRGVDFISISTEYPIERVLFNELLKAGIMA
ncbi:MAG: hypothetical protein IJW96_00315, partial [Clostridia bacterium]|nr:hypothetical protein [Clostridia bacterium]